MDNQSMSEEVEQRQLKYKKKTKRIKRMIRNMVFENSALCDQVAHIQENILCVKEERKFLLKKLIEYDKDILQLETKAPEVSFNADTITCGGSGLESPSTSQKNPHKPSHLTKTRKPYKKRNSNCKKAKKSAKREKKHQIIQTISVDEQGRPIYPIVMGDSLTVFELGEIVVNRLGYHNESWIYPVGYVSTRIYGHMLDPKRECVYTCKISDGGEYPLFEIIPDSDMEYAIAGPTPDLCHAALLQTLNSSSNGRHVEVRPQGEWFFGLGHPTVMTLLQSSPNIVQCFNFGGFQADGLGIERYNDATVNYEALQKYLSTSIYHTVPEVKEEPPDELLMDHFDGSSSGGII